MQLMKQQPRGLWWTPYLHNLSMWYILLTEDRNGHIFTGIMVSNSHGGEDLTTFIALAPRWSQQDLSTYSKEEYGWISDYTSAPMKAGKLSCLCAAEGSGTHTHTVGDALQYIKNYLNCFKALPIKPTIYSRPGKDGVHAEVAYYYWMFLSMFCSKKYD